jgi:hypothetical protein
VLEVWAQPGGGVNKEDFIKVKKYAVWASHLDRQKKKTNNVSYSNVRNGKKWLENRKYTRQDLLSVIRDKSWRGGGNVHYQRKKSPIHKTAEKKLLSPIPSTLTSLLQPNILMEGNDIDNFLSLLFSTNPNMYLMATHFGPHIRQYGETYWDEQMATRRSNSPQRAVALLQRSYYVHTMVHTREGHWSMVVWLLNINSEV